MGELRNKLMKESMIAGKDNTNKKTFIKVLVSELDKESKNGTESEIDIFKEVIKKTRKNLLITNSDESLLELTYLDKYIHEYLPEPIDIKVEMEKMISNYEGKLNIGVIMKYFSTNFKDRYNGKDLSILARKQLV